MEAANNRRPVIASSRATMTTTIVNTVSAVVVGVPSASVVEASTGTGNTLSAIDSVSDRLGTIDTGVVSTVAEAKTLSATVMGLAITDTAALTVSGGGGGGSSVFYDTFSTGDLTFRENNAGWTDSANATVQTGANIPAGLDTYALRLYDPAGSPTWCARRTSPRRSVC